MGKCFIDKVSEKAEHQCYNKNNIKVTFSMIFFSAIFLLFANSTAKVLREAHKTYNSCSWHLNQYRNLTLFNIYHSNKQPTGNQKFVISY